MMQIGINQYYIKARLIPAIITSIPIFSFYYFGLSKNLENYISFLENYKWAGDITISIALIYLLIQINRFISKGFFQKFYFKEELEMPTTNFLLYSNDTLAKSVKFQIREKIKSNFNTTLLNKNEEKQDILEAKKTIVGAVSKIRNSTRGNAMILQHNIEYGFARNLIGGCILAVLISLIGILYFNVITLNKFSINLNIFFVIIYLVPIIFSKKIIVSYGENYAKVLFEQFLSN
jgi:hypothetical protein